MHSTMQADSILHSIVKHFINGEFFKKCSPELEFHFIHVTFDLSFIGLSLVCRLN
jgi:hypothetical protein